MLGTYKQKVSMSRASIAVKQKRFETTVKVDVITPQLVLKKVPQLRSDDAETPVIKLAVVT